MARKHTANKWGRLKWNPCLSASNIHAFFTLSLNWETEPPPQSLEEQMHNREATNVINMPQEKCQGEGIMFNPVAQKERESRKPKWE